MPAETPPEPDNIVVRGVFHEKRIAALALTGILLTVFYVVGTLARWGSPHLLPRGEPLPSFALAGWDGRAVESGELRGANSVLLFFTLDCVHCKAMIRRMHEVKPAMRGAVRFHFISLNAPSEFKNLNPEVGNDSSVFFMDAGLARRILHIETVPVTLLLDDQGVLLAEIIGERTVGPLQHSMERAFAADHGE